MHYFTGGVDDIWQDTITKQLIIVDYKSQAKNGRVDKKDYLDDPFHEAYIRFKWIFMLTFYPVWGLM
tara:strand:- start:277 stop:477 length:201 start_codon:yes stop_codon:yes gene_type:complete